MKRNLITFIIALFALATMHAQEQYLGEIKICSFNFAPRGWAFCEGQLLPINQNQALFSLLGTTFGGDGQKTFALPDLRGRMVIGKSNTYPLGQNGGEATHTLTTSEIPTHTHIMSATTVQATTDKPTNQTMMGAPADIVLPQVTKNVNTYSAPANILQLSPQTSGLVGGSQPHQNLMPYITVRYIIALTGIYPSRP